MLELANCCCAIIGREKKKKEKKKREKKSKKRRERSKGSPLLPPKKKENAPERKFGGTNQISFFREIFLSQGERERERDPSISTRDLHKYTRHRGNI